MAMVSLANRHADGDLLEVGGAAVRLKVSRRARRVSLRLDRASGEVLAIAPSPRRLAEAVAFARERQRWIAERLAELPARVRFAPGAEIMLFGEPCRLTRAPGRASLEGVRWELGLRLAYGADEAAFSKAVVTLIKRRARGWFEARCEAYCRGMGAPLPKLSIMDARTRWGSCTPAQHGQPASMRFSWRLALAPVAIADYVAAHEC